VSAPVLPTLKAAIVIAAAAAGTYLLLTWRASEGGEAAAPALEPPLARAERTPAVEQQAHQVDQCGIELAQTVGQLSEPSASPAPAEPAAAPPAAAQDDEWETLPRTEFWFSERACRSPGELQAGDLFRNVELNPRDHYIPGSLRMELGPVVEAFVRKGADFRAAMPPLAVQEFNALVGQNGHIEKSVAAMHEELDERTKKKLAEVRKRIAAQRGVPESEVGDIVIPSKIAGGKTPHVMVIEGGKVKAALLEQLPAVQEAERIKRSLTLEFAARVVMWFADCGALTEAECNAITERCMRCFDLIDGAAGR
jgi:hypothetical protein